MKTTVNVRIGILLKISHAASRKGLSCSDMIVLLLKRTMEDITEPVRIGKMVQYQSRRNPDEWHAFHVNLRMDDYEYFMDMKKLLKMSISLMLANAVEKYLNEILTKKLSDNYQFKNYTVIKEIIDNIIIWKFIWGFPRNIGRLII